jgi:hypothetical protein
MGPLDDAQRLADPERDEPRQKAGQTADIAHRPRSAGALGNGRETKCIHRGSD